MPFPQKQRHPAESVFDDLQGDIGKLLTEHRARATAAGGKLDATAGLATHEEPKLEEEPQHESAEEPAEEHEEDGGGFIRPLGLLARARSAKLPANIARRAAAAEADMGRPRERFEGAEDERLGDAAKGNDGENHMQGPAPSFQALERQGREDAAANNRRALLRPKVLRK